MRGAKTWPMPGLFAMLGMASLFAGPWALAANWNVGLQEVEITDPVSEHAVRAALWYPTAEAQGQARVGPAILPVARGAEPASAERGLIVISHGFAGSFLGHIDTALALAANGYFVLTPTHPDAPGLAAGKPELDPLVARPRHLRLLLDKVLDAPHYQNRFPQQRIGIIGYSLGAYTALAAMGGRPGLDELDGYCAAQPEDELLCTSAAKQRLAALKPHLGIEPDGRFQAAVLLAPAYIPLFSEARLASLATPLLVFSAEQDRELNNAYHAERIARLLGDRAEHQRIAKAGHFVFMAPCPDALKQALAALCVDSPDVDRAAIHQTMNHRISEFFDTME